LAFNYLQQINSNILKGELKEMAEKENLGNEEAQEERGTGTQVRIKFNTGNLKSSYVNFCNVTSTREEVILNFGLNKDWDRSQREIQVDLEHRLILSPFAAKRLHIMLTNLLDNYERRFGKINIEPVERTGIQH